MISTGQLAPGICTQLPGSVPAQLLVPVCLAGLQQSNMWQQEAALQGPIVLQQLGTPQLSSSLQPFAEHPPAQQQGAAGSIEISKLKAVLQDILRSLPNQQPASTGSSSAGALAQLQGPRAVLDLPQQPVQHVQPQLQQQVYVSASGQQVVLVDGTQPMPMHQAPAYACATESSSCVQLQQLGAWGCMGAAAGSQHVLISTAVDQEVLMGVQQPQPPTSPNTVSSSAYCMPATMVGPSARTNLRADAALRAVSSGSCDSVSSPGTTGRQQASCTSCAGNQHLMAPGTPLQAHGRCMQGSCQTQQHLFTSGRPGQRAGSTARHAGSTGNHTGSTGDRACSRAGSTGGRAGNPVSRFGSTGDCAGIPASHPGSTGGHARNPASHLGITGRQAGSTFSHAGTRAMLSCTAGGTATALSAPGHAQDKAPAGDGPMVDLPEPWASMTLDEGLQQLWSSDQLQEAVGGCMYNTAERTAWEPDGALSAQDLFDFGKLKYVIHKLDASHRPRVRLVVRMHAVADYGGCDLKLFYFEVRCVISELGEKAGSRSLQGVRVLGLVRLALALQEALTLGPRIDT